MSERDNQNSRIPPNVKPAGEVGYKRPPRHTQFKKGQSGNPKGRPRGSKNLSTLFEQELNQKILITENGTRKKITKKHAIAKQVVNRAVSGDPKAIPILLNEDRAQRDSQGSAAQHDFMMTATDDVVIENLFARIRGSEPSAITEAAVASAEKPEQEPQAVQPNSENQGSSRDDADHAK